MPPRARRVPRRLVCVLTIAGVLALWVSLAFAHDGVADQIAGLSAQLARHPNSPDILVRRAALYREARQWKQALADLDRADRLDPTLPAPGLIRAHVFLDAQKWTAAVDAATRFLARRPGHADALLVRGRAQLQLGQTRPAVADFTRALDAQPLPDVYSERARAVARLGRGGLEEALHGLDEGIARLGSLVTLELDAVDLELQLHRYDAALARLDRLSAQAARKDSWLARRGAVLERAGRLEQAHATYTAALDSAASQPEHVRRTRASVTLTAQLRADIARLGNHAAPATHGLTRNR